MYCVHCGELWHDCCCIPWCYEHDTTRPCRACEHAEQERLKKVAMLAPFRMPWYVSLWKLLTGG